MIRRGRLYTRHRLSTFQLSVLTTVERMQPVYVGKSYFSLVRKGLIEPQGLAREGKSCRCGRITPEGEAAVRDAREAGWPG